MYEDFFADRISSLRNQKDVSAREMSLSLGQNSSYINLIENKHSFPSMRLFFYICEYLEISPKEFFDTEIVNPHIINEILKELKTLNDEQLNTVLSVSKGLNHKYRRCIPHRHYFTISHQNIFTAFFVHCIDIFVHFKFNNSKQERK